MRNEQWFSTQIYIQIHYITTIYNQQPIKQVIRYKAMIIFWAKITKKIIEYNQNEYHSL